MIHHVVVNLIQIRNYRQKNLKGNGDYHDRESNKNKQRQNI